jgi:hypothetical protein
LSKPIDKKLYKGTNPSCHDFNQTTATYEGSPLLVGFTTGQIQLVLPGRRDHHSKLFNEEVCVIIKVPLNEVVWDSCVLLPKKFFFCSLNSLRFGFFG